MKTSQHQGPCYVSSTCSSCLTFADRLSCQHTTSTTQFMIHVNKSHGSQAASGKIILASRMPEAMMAPIFETASSCLLLYVVSRCFRKDITSSSGCCTITSAIAIHTPCLTKSTGSLSIGSSSALADFRPAYDTPVTKNTKSVRHFSGNAGGPIPL